MGDIIAFPERRPPQPEPEEPLWREAAGRVLREERHAQDLTLAEVAGLAGVSTQHLSEVERGRKEASSEVLQAVTGALGLTLRDLTARVTRRLDGLVCLAA
jgi:transcriptional regulator with XRE-family HTH domain